MPADDAERGVDLLCGKFEDLVRKLGEESRERQRVSKLLQQTNHARTEEQEEHVRETARLSALLKAREEDCGRLKKQVNASEKRATAVGVEVRRELGTRCYG